MFFFATLQEGNESTEQEITESRYVEVGSTSGGHLVQPHATVGTPTAGWPALHPE